MGSNVAATSSAVRRAWAYLRISRDEAGDELGVRRQEAALRELIDRNGWVCAGVFEDNDQSAYRGRHRDGYQRLLAAVGPGDVIVCTEVTRLTRHPRELEDLVDFVEQRDVSITALRAGQMDLQTSGGRAVARLLGVFARMESEQIGERVSAKHRQNAAAGRAHGGAAPYGYRRSGPGELAIDPEQAEVIRWAVARVIDGASINALVIDLNARAVPSARGGAWQPSSLGKLLRSPTIAGLRTAAGEVIGDAAWQPIIDRATHERVVARLTHAPVGPRARRNVLAGYVVCGVCGQRMKGRTEGRSGDRGRQYACDKVAGGCGSCSASADRVEDHVISRVLLLAAEIDLRAVRGRAATVDIDRLVAQLEADEQQRDDLAADYGNRDITRAEWLAARSPVLARIAETKAALAASHTTTSGADIDLDGLTPERWEEFSFDRRRAVIDLFVDRITIAKGTRGRTFDPSRITITWTV